MKREEGEGRLLNYRLTFQSLLPRIGYLCMLEIWCSKLSYSGLVDWNLTLSLIRSRPDMYFSIAQLSLVYTRQQNNNEVD
jgi:hypothetical protein